MLIGHRSITKDNSMSDNLEKIILKINKKFGENTIGTLKMMPSLKYERISTGSPYVDWATGGGFPLGRSVELYGPPSSGKSLIAMRTIVEAQKKGLKCVYLDCENAFDPNYAKKIGVDTDKLVISQIVSGEDTFDLIDMILDSSEVSLIVVDSVASLLPTYEVENEMGKQTMGLHARLMSKAMRRVTGKASRTKTLLLFINQVRTDIGSYGSPQTTTGGQALKFYSSLRVEVRRGDFILDNKRKIGQQIKFKVTKSKVGQPFRDGYFTLYYFDPEHPELDLFDTADELVSMLLIQEKIKRRGAYYDVVGKTFQGREEMESEIRSNDDFREKLIQLSKKKDDKNLNNTYKKKGENV